MLTNRSRVRFRGIPSPHPFPPAPPTVLSTDELLRVFTEIRTLVTDLQKSVAANAGRVEELAQGHTAEIEKWHAHLEEVRKQEGPPGKNADPAEPGKDGKSPDVNEIVQKVIELLPQPDNVDTDAIVERVLERVPTPTPVQPTGITEGDVKTLIKKHTKRQKPQPIDHEPIVETVLKEIEKKHGTTKHVTKEMLDKAMTEMRGHVNASKEWRGGGDTVVAGTGVTIENTVNGNKRISASGGGGTNIANEQVTAVQSGSDVTIDLTQLSHPYLSVILVLLNQIPQTLDNTYFKTGDIVTIPNADAGGIFAIVYTYA